MYKLMMAIMCLSMSGPAPGEATPLEEVVEGQIGLTCDLYQELAPQPGNLFFSPASISAALAMTHGGAQGQTAFEMAKALHFPSDPKAVHAGHHALRENWQSSGLVTIANRLWPALGLNLKSSFLNLCSSNYGALPEALDFAAQPETSRLVINAWAEENTRGLITDLLRQGDIDPTTLMVLTNAIHFKGSWAAAFVPEQTRPGNFHSSPTQTVEARFMRQEGQFPFGVVNGVQLLEMPYADSNLAMLVALPEPDRDLAELEAALSPTLINDWANSLRETVVLVQVPRFGMTYRTELRETLQNLGMKLAFTGGADFGAMTNARIFLDQVIHKARIEVDEEGTEAAAVTAVTLRKSAKPRFRADRPFLFLIRDTRTGAVLFAGRVVDPGA